MFFFVLNDVSRLVGVNLFFFFYVFVRVIMVFDVDLFLVDLMDWRCEMSFFLVFFMLGNVFMI